MKARDWERVHVLVEQALARPEEGRRTFVESACGDDMALRDEAISLLAACERSPETQRPATAWLELLDVPAPPKFVPGQTVANRYRIGRLIGRGGMGEVYDAWDEELAIPVALKTIHLPGRTEEAHRRLKLEGILARSVWHPNVCRLYDLGRHEAGTDATWFLTMELLRGETLARELQAQGRLPLDRAQRIAEQMAAALGAAHHAGVVHRDFKPGNVMLVNRDGGEQAVVTDFGIARALSLKAAEVDPKQESGPIAGTPIYMAPEQMRGESVGPAADIYSLGIVLHKMVTGTVPFGGDSAIDVARRRLVEDPPSPRHLVPDLDDRWEAVILRCLARAPERRFVRAEDVAEALGRRVSIATVAPVDPGTMVPHMLPAERDLFVGREMESEDLERHLAASSRLVTLVGAGGMGKTRLAVHYGWRNLGEWPGGVWFCDLTEARSLDGIASAVAGSLGVQLGRGDSVELLGRAIARRGRCLLILDNVEQVVDLASVTVGRWLGKANEARFLVTSREKLSLPDQTLLAVGPLSIETGTELFLARARRLRPGLEVSSSEVESAREIVRLVDGMPLAIELASARMRVMSAAQIVAQMRRRFSLLTGGGNVRHETLVAAIDGSWELLRAWERSAWAQCAVFEGGFTLEAAEGVIDLSAWPDAPWVVDVVQSLVDKSLLRTSIPADRTGDGTPEARFGMFVSLQEYARMKLREDGDSIERAVEQRHGEWYSRYGTLEAIRKHRQRGGLVERRRAERELDNLVAACRRGAARGDGATVVTAYQAAWAVLEMRGPFSVAVDLGREVLRGLHLERAEEVQVLQGLGQAEGNLGMMAEARAHLEAAHATAWDLADNRLETRALMNLGGMMISHGQMEEASVHLEKVVEVARSLSDRDVECNALSLLGIVGRGRGQLSKARTCTEQALQLAALTGDLRMEGVVLNNLGLILQDQGHIEEARARYKAALALHREVGDRRFEGNAHGNLGTLNYAEGRLEEARDHYEKALAIHRETGSRLSEAIVLNNLGSLRHMQDLTEEARAYFEAALAVERELGHRRFEGQTMGALARLHQDAGELDQARNYYESALAIHRAESNKPSEGYALAHLASLFHRLGAIDAAREALAAGETLLRQVDSRLYLGQLLCVRAELEHGTGDTPASLGSLGEAEDLAARLGAGPASELGRMIAKARQTLHAQ